MARIRAVWKFLKPFNLFQFFLLSSGFKLGMFLLLNGCLYMTSEVVQMHFSLSSRQSFSDVAASNITPGHSGISFAALIGIKTDIRDQERQKCCTSEKFDFKGPSLSTFIQRIRSRWKRYSHELVAQDEHNTTRTHDTEFFLTVSEEIADEVASVLFCSCGPSLKWQRS